MCPELQGIYSIMFLCSSASWWPSYIQYKCLHKLPPLSLVSWQPVYPASDKYRLEGTTEDLLTYHDSIGVEVVIRAAANAPGGERSFVGELHYQACDKRRCLFPTSVPLTFKVVLTGENPGKWRDSWLLVSCPRSKPVSIARTAGLPAHTRS